MKLWSHQNAVPAFRIGIAGDFLPANGLIPATGRPWSAMAESVAGHFADLAFSIANLECPLDVADAPPRAKASSSDTFAAPKQAVDYLHALGIGVVGLANNHIFDYETTGVATTRRVIEEKGMAPLGTGRTLQQPPEVHFQSGPCDTSLAVWAAARRLPENATRESAGTEPATHARAQQALQVMTGQRASCRIALVHAGAEHTNYPDPRDVNFMDSLAAMGFDIVAACHSHRISGYKRIPREGKAPAFCFYGLGSLSSGILYSPLEREGIIPVIGLDESGSVVHVEVRPVYLDPPGWGRVPSPAQADLVMNRFLNISAEIQEGNYRDHFYREISKNLFRTQWNDCRAAFRGAGVSGLVSKMKRFRPAHVRQLFYKGITSVGLR